MKKLSTHFSKIFVLIFIFSIVTDVKSQQNPTKSWRKMGENRGAKYDEIKSDFDQFWKDRKYVKGSGYKVFKRWEQYSGPRTYPSGNLSLPSTSYSNYIEWQKSNSGKAANVRVSAAAWTALGPFVKPTGYDSGVGRTNFVRFDPTDSQKMFVGTPDGGLWKTVNGGTSWTTNGDFLPVIGCADLVIDPTNTQIMYLATGDKEGDRFSIGVLKTTDGGANWLPTGLSKVATDFFKISRLLMDPNDHLTILASTSNSFYKTIDGGTNWVQIIVDPAMGADNVFKDMKAKPDDFNTLYIASTKIYKSTDKGDTWTELSTGLPLSGVQRISLGVSAAEPQYIYALYSKAPGTASFKGFYKSIDGGTNFAEVTAETPLNLLGNNEDGSDLNAGQGHYTLALGVSPTDAEKVFVGGVNTWTSTNGGTSWAICTYWLGAPNPNHPETITPYIHADTHEINYAPGSGTVIYNCNDGGISKSTDNGATWTDISNNLPVSQQNRVGLSTSDLSLKIASLQDIGTIQTNGSWKIAGGGDGEDNYVDRTNDNNIIIIGTNGDGARSIDRGATYTSIGTIDTGTFFSPIHGDPVTAGLIYFGGRPKLWTSTDVGDTWTEKPGASPFNTDPIEEFAIAESDNQIIYAIKYNAISKSIDAGNSWSDKTTGLPVGSSYLTNLCISNTDPLKVWVTFSGYDAANKVFKTIDGGSTWTNISTGLPNLPINTIVYEFDNPNDKVYIGADIGIYFKNNTGGWIEYDNLLPHVSVRDLEIFYPLVPAPKGLKPSATAQLVAATYGRGTWQTDIELAQAPLDVTLIDFNGKNIDDRNELDWTTTSETNFAHFEVQRSTDVSKFEIIGKVLPNSFTENGKGKAYRFNDLRPKKGANFYRLKNVDLDGTASFSKLILVNTKSVEDYKIYPNPASESITVELNNPNFSVDLISASGRNIFNKTNISNKITIPTKDIPNGFYFVKVLSGDGKFDFSSKVSVMK